MTLLDLQNQVCEALNADEALLKGGCRAFAEDSLTVEFDAESQLQEQGAVAIVVMTPRADRDGGSTGELFVAVQNLEVACSEKPGLNRTRSEPMTALAAAQRAARLLESDTFTFVSIRQDADPEIGVLTATATFSTNIFLD